MTEDRLLDRIKIQSILDFVVNLDVLDTGVMPIVWNL